MQYKYIFLRVGKILHISKENTFYFYLGQNVLQEDLRGLYICLYKFRIWLFIYLFLAVPRVMRDLSSLTRDRICAPCSGNEEP